MEQNVIVMPACVLKQGNVVDISFSIIIKMIVWFSI